MPNTTVTVLAKMSINIWCKPNLKHGCGGNHNIGTDQNTNTQSRRWHGKKDDVIGRYLYLYEMMGVRVCVRVCDVSQYVHMCVCVRACDI